MSDRHTKLHWTTVASFNDSTSANLARLRLEEEEIPCFLDNENTVTTLWHYINALGGIKLRVPDEHVEQAREILNEHAEAEGGEVDADDPTPELEEEHFVACPRCLSTDTSPFSWRLRIVQAAAIVLLSGVFLAFHPAITVVGAAFAVYFLITKPDFRCTRCGWRWSHRSAI